MARKNIDQWKSGDLLQIDWSVRAIGKDNRERWTSVPVMALVINRTNNEFDVLIEGDRRERLYASSGRYHSTYDWNMTDKNTQTQSKCENGIVGNIITSRIGNVRKVS